jgi:hypothetical protein
VIAQDARPKLAIIRVQHCAVGHLYPEREFWYVVANAPTGRIWIWTDCGWRPFELAYWWQNAAQVPSYEEAVFLAESLKAMEALR